MLIFWKPAKDWLKTNFSWWVDENQEKTSKKLAKNQQLSKNQQKTGKKPIFPKSVQTFGYYCYTITQTVTFATRNLISLEVVSNFLLLNKKVPQPFLCVVFSFLFHFSFSLLLTKKLGFSILAGKLCLFWPEAIYFYK